MFAIAHVSETEQRKTHSLLDHLNAVERLAAEFASQFDASEWAGLAGRWHDLGKFSDGFQRYIRRESGFEKELAGNAPGRVDHSTAGTLLAEQRFSKSWRLIGYAIAGHHAGLPDGSAADGAGASSLENRLLRGKNDELLTEARRNAPESILDSAEPTLPSRMHSAQGLHLWIRMLFSCLVDADYLDTERFHNPERAALRGSGPDIQRMLDTFNLYIQQKMSEAPLTELNGVRADVLRQCRQRAACAPGFFTLTVPTGGGKTLSSLAFALEHARRFNKQRIIYAIPYTSIIEQTADVFRSVFCDLPGSVLEHHSNIRVEAEKDAMQSAEPFTKRDQLAVENWDAPLITTTNVQFYESLFAAQPSRCRKLHNIVNSVVILDEAQLLPPDFLQPILNVLKLLVQDYGVTVVLCTATQPALKTLRAGAAGTLLRGIDDATEIVVGTEEVYRKLDRTRIHTPENGNQRERWEDIARRLQQHESVLAIVNTRADCRALHTLMPKGTVHLSALMCGEHRSDKIRQIRETLKANEQIHVVSTQLIEAGVDVDFPVVYRAMAGLDSIAQAAGRCNREGRLPTKGDVYVFLPPTEAPPGLLRIGEETSRILLEDHPFDLMTPEQFRRYFEHYYARAARNSNLDRKGILPLLEKSASQWCVQFRAASNAFQLIEETTSIVVPYRSLQDGSPDSRIILKRLRAGEMHRDLLRSLQRFTVSLRQYDLLRLQQDNEIEEVVPGIWALRSETAYSEELGLLIGGTGSADPASLCC